jgi:hypothetical protein
LLAKFDVRCRHGVTCVAKREVRCLLQDLLRLRGVASGTDAMSLWDFNTGFLTALSSVR